MPSLTTEPSAPEVTQSTVVADSVTYSARTNSWDISPWKANGNTATTMYTQLYAGLLANPAYGTTVENMQKDMAQSVTFSSDKLTATIKLKDYIHDSKGNPITASDVVFSYETAPKVSGLFGRLTTTVASIKALDDYTVEMTLAANIPGAWELTLSYCPVISQKWYESASDDEKSSDPACTGAYKVAENIPGTSATFVAVDNFWQKDADRTIYEIVNVKTIKYVCIAETAMRVIALQNGELDSGYIESVNASDFENDPNFNLNETWQSNPSTFVFNCSANSVFHDNVNLRKAVLYATDFEQLGIASSSGFGFQGHDVAPALSSNYNKAWDDQPYYDYNVDVAKDYMQKAGYDPTNSGLTIHFMVRNMAHNEATIAVMQSCLEDIGINMIIDSIDQALFDTYTPDPTKWDIMWFTTNMSTGFVTEAWDYYYGDRGDLGSVGFVKDPKLQELLDAAIKNNDEASLNAFHDYAVDQAYAVNQRNEPVYVVTRKDITQMPFSFVSNPIPNAFVFSSDY